MQDAHSLLQTSAAGLGTRRPISALLLDTFSKVCNPYPDAGLTCMPRHGAGMRVLGS